LDFFNLLVTAKLGFRPADDDFLREVGVRDDVAFRRLKADAAICASGIGAVVGVDRVMNSKDNTVSEDALNFRDM
jgi:hypothetical protein